VFVRVESTQKERRYRHEKDSGLSSSSGGCTFNRRRSGSSRTNVVKFNDDDGDDYGNSDADGNDHNDFGAARLSSQSPDDNVYYDIDVRLLGNHDIDVRLLGNHDIDVRMLRDHDIVDVYVLSSNGLRAVHKLHDTYVQHEQFCNNDGIMSGEIKGVN
jgi:hypothetical protein